MHRQKKRPLNLSRLEIQHQFRKRKNHPLNELLLARFIWIKVGRVFHEDVVQKRKANCIDLRRQARARSIETTFLFEQQRRKCTSGNDVRKRTLSVAGGFLNRNALAAGGPASMMVRIGSTAVQSR